MHLLFVSIYFAEMSGGSFAVDLSRPYAKRCSDEPRSHYAQRLQFINALVSANPNLDDDRIEVLSNCYTNVKFLNNRYHPEVMQILEKHDPELRLVNESKQQSIAHIKTPK